MLSHLKRRFGVLAAVAVMAALVPAIASSPVSATPATTAITVVGSDATYAACPTGSAAAAGFTDTTSTDVDCINMFGITQGTTATTYSPTDSVPRWQMALFLTRALAPAGGTLGAGADQGFTDISGKSDEIQLAINQIAELGITVGTNAAGTLFDPDSNVSREQMALFIERFLENVKAGPGGQSDADADAGLTAAQVTYVNSDCAGSTACTGAYNYTDIDAGSVTVEGANAIKELYDLGIHDGVSATTFNPSADMTRASMATFLTTALDQTNARPEGLWLQASKYTNAGSHTPTLSVSDRDSSFAPVADTPVDVFYWTTSAVVGNAAFLSTGLCDDSVATGAAITKCYIDTGEPTTNTLGNVTPTAVQTDPYAILYEGSDVYYAWTAAAGTTYDNDVNGSGTDYSSVTVAATAAAAETRCTMDTPANTQMTAVATHVSKFAAVTTISCQLTDGALATSGNVATALRKVKMDLVRTFSNDVLGLQSGNQTLATSEIGLTDATGAVSFTITGPANPNTAVGDIVTDVVVLSDITGGAINDGGVLDSYSGNMVDSGSNMTFTLNYLDTAAVATTSGLTSTATSGLANATTGITRTYTGTVYDQYGDTVAAETGTFSSSSTLPGGLACTAVTPSVCTTLAAHGLDVGDDVIFTGMGAGVLSTGFGGTNAILNAAAAGLTPSTGSSWLVKTVPSTTTFTLWDGATVLGGMTIAGGAGTASTDASPITAVTTSTAIAARTTSTDGTASLSWTDLEATSGLDTITFTPATAAVSTKKFFRLAAASDFTSTDANGTLIDGETNARLVEWDGTNDDFILEIRDAADESNTVTSYRQYTFDDNDHFAVEGVVAGALVLNGTAATQAVWEALMATSLTAALPTGSANDVVFVDYGSGLATDINRFTADAG
tara:strand:- start:63 stop:2759 length:2697 start_codon:yes stop_codon:yes gene_type:complete